jgi:cyclic pyranopterin phosphate synthase
MPKQGVSLIGHDDILRYEEILRIVKIAVLLGFSKIRITGGEPLARRNILGFVSSLRNIDGLNDIALTTNGILLESYAEGLFAAGVKRVNISLDSLQAEKYAHITRGGDLSSVLAGIEKAYHVGFAPIKINVVTMKGFNDDEILSFAGITFDRPYRVRFIELMPIGHAGMDNRNRYLSSDFILAQIRQHYEINPIPEKNKIDGPARRYKITGSCGEIGFISSMSNHFCRSCNRLRLTADGHIRSCLFSDEEVDLKTLLRSGIEDIQLTELIKDVIARKPMKYEIPCEGTRIKKCMKEMSSIGG